MATIFLLFLSFLNLSSATISVTQAKSSTNPFTAKAALIRYWNRKVSNNLPHPYFIVSKLTPLSAVDASTFSTLATADPSKLSTHLFSFCSSAALLCSTDLTPSLSSHPGDSDFTKYESSNFTNYDNEAAGGLSSFKNYSDGLNVPFDTFRRYGRDSAGHDDSFSFYAPDGNVVTANFTSYGTSTAGGVDNFTSYDHSSNVPDLGFINYAAEGNGRAAGFSLYSGNANSGDQSFSGYGKIGNGVITEFASYANNSNVIGSVFANYGEDANVNKDTFTSYGDNGNVPENNFRSYGSGTNAGSDKFMSYRDQSNVGDDSFVSYEKGGNDATAEFIKYGKSFNQGSDAFKGYGEGSGNDHINFKSYFGDNTTFKAYAKAGIDFKSYRNSSSSLISTSATMRPRMNRWVEPGKFFRETNLKKGTVMPMPDLRDRMPPRSFLPRSISGKIPFSAAAVAGIFKIPPGSAMAKAVDSTVGDCERPPSRGETKRCAASAEDMIDFAVSVLGSNVAVKSSMNTKGSMENILIGEVKGMNGGKVTKSVSCHQSLFPYLVYYCHSVPRVRVYEAEILAVDGKKKINQGIAICHIDTSDWSPTHGAFVALGPGPGKIEVCHWIYEGDMTWTIADRP